jgi:hypothetical protein
LTKSSTAYCSGAGLVGARVGDRLAVFNATDGALVSGSLQVDQGGTYRAHLANLTPGGEYAITAGGTTQRLVATAAGTLYVSVTISNGATITVSATGLVVPLPPSPPDPFDVSLLRPPANLRIIR